MALKVLIVDDEPLARSRLRTLLGDSFLAVELPSASKKDHSVLTEQRDEASVQRVLQFFQDKLLVPEVG